MAVSIYIKMENSDSYLECFDDLDSLEHIKETLENTVMDNGPICDWEVSVSKNVEQDFESEVEDIISELMERSWSRDED